MRSQIECGRSSPSTYGLVVTWALMIPLFCLASGGVLWFRGGVSNGLAAQYGALASSGSGTNDNALMSLGLLAVLTPLLFPRMRVIANQLLRDKAFLILCGWMALSSLWSPLPLVSLEWSAVMTLNIMFAFYLTSRFKPEEQIQLFLALGWLCLGLSVALAVVSPAYGTDAAEGSTSWRGIYFHKNVCAMTTAILAMSGLYASAHSARARVLRAVFLAGSAFLIFMTQSATGKLCIVALGFIMACTCLIRRCGPREKVIVLGSGAVIAIFTVVAGFAYLDEFSRFLGKDPTLTGRTDIWRAVVVEIAKRPLLGYGYRSFWHGYDGESANVALASHWAVTSAHNAFLEAWLGLGAIGMMIVLFTLWRAVRDAFRCLIATDSPYAAWCAGMIALTLLMSVDEGELLIPNSLLSFLYVLACIGLSNASRRLRAGHANAA